MISTPLKNIPNLSVLLILCHVLQIKMVSSYVLSAYEIKDLDSNDIRFSFDTKDWINSPLFNGTDQPFTQCNSIYLLGGYGVLGPTGSDTPQNYYFQRVFTDLPPHYIIYFTFQLWMIDSWEADDIIEIELDSIVFNGWNLSTSSSSFLTDLCGDSSPDLAPINIVGSISHNTSSLIFTVTAKTNEATIYKSFGLRALSLLFGSGSTLNMDSICGNVPIPLSSLQCSCPDGQFENSLGSCESCHPYCDSCFGPLETECYKCKEGYSFNGTGCFPCSSSCASCNGPGLDGCTSCSSGYVLFQNSTCIPISSCVPPLITTYYDTFCESPCSISDFVLWNGNCSSTCNFPLQDNGLLLDTVKTCDYPCANGDYLYWNGTCFSTCPLPFEEVISNDRAFCNMPCSDPDHFLNWNRTCLPNCDPFFLENIIEEVKVCEFPCINGKYLYFNGSCLFECASPFKSRNESGNLFCDLPCNPSEFLYLNGTCLNETCQFPFQQTQLEGIIDACVSACSGSMPYLYYNNTCLGDCLMPFKQGSYYGIQTCELPCNDSNHFAYWNGTCSPVCDGFFVSTIVDVVKVCQFPCTNSGEFLYYDGLCKPTCPSPFKSKIEGGKSFCNLPCKTNEFLYVNGTCIAKTCQFPFQQTILSGVVNACISVCVGTKPYLYYNNTCLGTCLTPYRLGAFYGIATCNLPCTDPSHFVYWNGTCSPVCGDFLISTMVEVIKVCKFPCTKTGEFLYYNGSCKSGCLSPFKNITEGGMPYCKLPCNTGEFLYVNGTCLTNTCQFPYQHIQLEGVVDACVSVCAASTPYLYWNNTCLGACDSPLAIESFYGIATCKFPCNAGEFLYWNGTCKAFCDAPLSQRLEGGVKFCDYLCASTQYLFWNGDCDSTCPTPLKARTEATKLYCDLPCNLENFLYWNGSCLASCNSPLSQSVVHSVNLCEYPCVNTGEYLYWNGSCKSICPNPYKSKVEAGKSYCILPCNSGEFYYLNATCIANSCQFPYQYSKIEGALDACVSICDVSTPYLYWNNSCLGSCPNPLVTGTFYGIPTCKFPCNTGEFLYWNGSCKTQCNSPLSQRLEGGVKFCDFPCASSSHYLFWNGTCDLTCPTPLNPRTEATKLYCDLPCNLADFLYWNGSCLGSCSSPLSQKVQQLVKVCDYPCSSTQYLYWNGSCNSACSSPYKSKVEAGKSYCILPCNSGEFYYLNATCIANSCQFPYQYSKIEGALDACVSICDVSTPYLYWNNSCLGSCPNPLLIGTFYGIPTCKFPCNTGEFLYWNGSCKTQCNSPLSQRLEGGVKFCDFPCASSIHYLFWNGTCDLTCPTPLNPRTEATNLYCDLPCNLADFLYWNRSCLGSCNSPLSQKVQQLVKVCEYKCSFTQFLYWNGTCADDCAYPLKTRIENFINYCELPCDINDFLHWNGSCLKSCDFPLASRVQYTVKLCAFSCAHTSQYLYWNGTCSDSCPSFYLPSFQSGRSFCSPKCSSDKFLFTNTSKCVQTCPGGFFENHDTKLCQECQDSLCNYCPANSNGKCLECKEFAILDVNNACKKCESLKVEFVKSTSKYHQYRLRLTPSSCDLDLSVVQNHFNVTLEARTTLPPHSLEILKLNKNLYQVNLALHSALFEPKDVGVELFYLKGSMGVPKTLISEQALEKLAASSPVVQSTLVGMMGASFGGTIALGAAAALWSILSFQQFVGYFSYLNVEFPLQVKLFLSLFKSISWDLLPNPLAFITSRWSKDILTLEDDLKQYHPPKKFVENEITSFFIENAGPIFATNFLLLVVLMIVILLKRVPRLKKKQSFNSNESLLTLEYHH